MMWDPQKFVPREHLNVLKMLVPEPQIRYFHTSLHYHMKTSPHTHTHTLRAHIYHTHTDTDVTRQAYRSHTEQTHIYTDTHIPQTYAQVATYTHTHTHISTSDTHTWFYTQSLVCLR